MLVTIAFGLMLDNTLSQCVVPENIHTLPHWKFQGGGGVSKTQKFKAMYEAKLEFPEGWGDHRANPFRGGGGGGGMDIFWNHTI